MKTYSIKKISSEADINACELFEITDFQWEAKRKPYTKGRIGYIEGKGLYIEMETDETDTIVTHHNDREMVCDDSAMEVFAAFPRDGIRPESTDVPYFNFEINAEGCMYAKFGESRKERDFLSEDTYDRANVETIQSDEGWSLNFYIPESSIAEKLGYNPFSDGHVFYMNFYKIAQNEEIIHFGAFNHINSDHPDFHRPQDFAEVRITE